ncbi:hypothetical protein PYCCODRAFT_887896 [Trametes coccinea BRFM310]|uniref:Uncharacterized protein n=1 Tax=Trametes coccinea (strain BRFM310) TaxID=1353009 RepID=A0A1Y2ID38_TRAC3|nr:hypothetical protein PYCCODRAFT_887896 [Trametes coccinea BRFM310]
MGARATTDAVALAAVFRNSEGCRLVQRATFLIHFRSSRCTRNISLVSLLPPVCCAVVVQVMCRVQAFNLYRPFSCPMDRPRIQDTLSGTLGGVLYPCAPTLS